MPRHNVHQVEIIRTGLDHSECINFGSDGRLYAGGFAGSGIRYDPTRIRIEAVGEDGRFRGRGSNRRRPQRVPMQHAGGRCVQRVTQKGEVATFCRDAPDGPLVMPNYGSFDALGNYYFSDSGDYWQPSGRLIRVAPNGQVTSLIGGNWHYANGLAISPKDGSVFMIESTAADILRIPLEGDGRTGRPEICRATPRDSTRRVGVRC